MNTPHWSSEALLILQVLTLAMSRPMGAALFIPFLSRQQVPALARAALCMALALPPAAAMWPAVQAAPPNTASWLALLLKEGVLGALIGMLIAVPFWAIRGMGTLIDNQRGANAAQQVNPALQADATLIGELSERALVALLIDWGVLTSVYGVLFDSYGAWSALDIFPALDAAHGVHVVAALIRCVSDALVLAAPVLLLLLLIELGLAIASTAVQGFDVYGSAMPVKTISSLLILALIAPGLLDHVGTGALSWWRHGIQSLLGWQP